MQKISISGPAELVTIVPYELGFRPERSVVAICFRGKQIGFVARLDAVALQEASQLAAEFGVLLNREAPTGIALVSYEAEPGECGPLADALGVVSGLARIPVIQDLVVRDGRWYSRRDDGCPDEGERLPAPADVPGVAAFVALGRSVVGGRKELEAMVTPVQDGGSPERLAAVLRWRRDYRVARHDRFLRELSIAETLPAPMGADDPARSIDLVPDRNEQAGMHPAGRTVRLHPDPGHPAERLDVDPFGGRFGDPYDGAHEPWDDLYDLYDDYDHVDDSYDDVDDFGDDSYDLSDKPQGEPSRWDELTDECFAAWGRLVRGEVDDNDFERMLDPMLPALVGPLEDRDVRDALIGWLSPGWLPTEAIEARLLERLRVLMGPVEPEPIEPGPAQPEQASGGGPDHRLLDGVSSRRPLQDRLDALCRATPAQVAAPLLTVSAAYAWWRGDGTRASICVDRALEIEPDHRLAKLMRLGLDRGLRPHAA